MRATNFVTSVNQCPVSAPFETGQVESCDTFVAVLRWSVVILRRGHRSTETDPIHEDANKGFRVWGIKSVHITRDLGT